MTGTIFLGGTARRKPSGARSQVCRSLGNQSVQQAEASVVSQKKYWWAPGEISRRNKPRSRGLGPGLQPLGGLGAGGLQGLWAWAPKHQTGFQIGCHQFFVFQGAEDS